MLRTFVMIQRSFVVMLRTFATIQRAFVTIQRTFVTMVRAIGEIHRTFSAILPCCATMTAVAPPLNRAPTPPPLSGFAGKVGSSLGPATAHPTLTPKTPSRWGHPALQRRSIMVPTHPRTR